MHFCAIFSTQPRFRHGHGHSESVKRKSSRQHAAPILPYINGSFCWTFRRLLRHTAGEKCWLKTTRHLKESSTTADWNLQKWWRRTAQRPTEIYRKIEEEQHDGQQKSTERIKENSTTAEGISLLQSKDICGMMTCPDWAATNSRRNGHARQTDGKRLTGDIKEERPSVTGKPPLYITLNCDCPILINKTIYGKTKSCKSKLKRQ